MNLIEHYFLVIIQSVGSVYWTIAILLFFLKVPQVDGYRPYRQAKRFLSAAYFVMGLNLFAWLVCYSNNWQESNPYVYLIDISLFYMAALFFGCCFYSLIDNKGVTPGRAAVDLAEWAVTTLCLGLTLLPSLSNAARFALVGIALLLFLQLVGKFVYRFYQAYRRKKQALDNYFSEDMQRFMFWVWRAIVFLLFMGVFAIATLFLDIVFNYLYQVYVVGTNLYIAISFINYSDLYGQLHQADEVPAEEAKEEAMILEVNKDTAEEVNAAAQKKLSLDNYESLFGESMSQWLADKKYLQQQFTIEDLAAELGTNKLYLSRYINQKFNLSFSNWVTSLRIGEAKEYMRQQPLLKQEEVAFHCGFSSSSYFSKVFSRVEHMTPAQWRKENCQ